MDATAANQFDFVRLTARQAGTAGEGIARECDRERKYDRYRDFIRALLRQRGRSSVTPNNPAVPGELISIYGTGLGLIDPPASFNLHTGMPYDGPALN